MPTTTKAKIVEITTALRMKELPLKKQDELTIELNSLIFRSALVRFIGRLPKKERLQYRKLIDEGASIEECGAFLRAHRKKMDTSIAEAVDELASDILVSTA